MSAVVIRRTRACAVATYPPGATFGPRRLRDHELVWLIEGDASYRWGDQVVAAPQGSVVLCRPTPPGHTDAFTWDPHRRTRHGFLHFDLGRVPAHWPAPRRWPMVRDPQHAGILAPMLRFLLTWHARGDRDLVRLTVAHVVTAFVTGQTGLAGGVAAVYPAPVERALAHLHAALADDPAAPLPLADLARAAHVTAEHLCRLFRAATGRSPAQTVRLARLDHAAVLLARSNYAVGAVADQCGFASPYHFSRAFKAAFGQSPRALRRALADGAAPPTPRLSSVAPA